MAHDNAAERDRIREAILRHLEANPAAADTAKGIVECWLPPTDYERAPDHIAAVLDDMVARHWLRAEPLPDGKTLYRRSR